MRVLATVLAGLQATSLVYVAAAPVEKNPGLSKSCRYVCEGVTKELLDLSGQTELHTACSRKSRYRVMAEVCEWCVNDEGGDMSEFPNAVILNLCPN